MKKWMMAALLLFSLVHNISVAQVNPEELISEQAEQPEMIIDRLGRPIIANFKRVNDGIYRGSRLDSLDSQRYVRSLGVKTIINLQGGDFGSRMGKLAPWSDIGENPEVIENERKAALLLGMSFFHAKLSSFGEVSFEEDKAIDETLAFMNDSSNLPLYIHCEDGADRTGLIIALYRVKYEGVNPKVARTEWINNGHNFYHRMLTGGLDRYFDMKVKQLQK